MLNLNTEVRISKEKCTEGSVLLCTRVSHSHGVSSLVGADVLVVADDEGAEDDIVEAAVSGHGVDVVTDASQFSSCRYKAILLF